MVVPSFAYFTIWIPVVAAAQGWIHSKMIKTSVTMRTEFCLDMIFILLMDLSPSENLT
jgi:hypothetical protein